MQIYACSIRNSTSGGTSPGMTFPRKSVWGFMKKRNVVFAEYHKADLGLQENMGPQMTIAPSGQRTIGISSNNYHRIALFGNSINQKKKKNISNGYISD